MTPYRDRLNAGEYQPKTEDEPKPTKDEVQVKAMLKATKPTPEKR